MSCSPGLSIGIPVLCECFIFLFIALTRPTPDQINRLANYLPYRTKAVENAKHQLFPERIPQDNTPHSPFSSENKDLKLEKNVVSIMTKIENKSLLVISDKNRGVINPFSGKVANSRQEHDLLHFREIGQIEFDDRIKYYILKTPSTQAPNRKRRLETFAEKRVKSRKISQLEKDKHLVLAAMKRKMKHSHKTGIPIDSPGEQLIQLPLALCDHDGLQNKGQKSYTTKSLEARYKDIFTSDIPVGWQPECVLLEGMFLINTKPLGMHKCLADYANFLLARHVATQFSRGAVEVHIIFDNPGRLHNTPKYFEQLRRDATRKTPLDHYCDDLQGNTRIPNGNWQDNIVGCRECKRRLVNFLGSYFLGNLYKYLQAGQTAYVAGHLDGQAGDIAWFVCGKNRPQPEPIYKCEAEETDTRLWLHATKSPFHNILILSPDTDVYHIGLPLACVKTKEIIVQVSAINSRQLKLLHLSALVNALDNDPDLSKIDPKILPQVLQTLYVVSGCDYISFFSNMGKATFLRYFYQYALITGDKDLPGTLVIQAKAAMKKVTCLSSD